MAAETPCAWQDGVSLSGHASSSGVTTGNPGAGVGYRGGKGVARGLAAIGQHCARIAHPKALNVVNRTLCLLRSASTTSSCFYLQHQCAAVGRRLPGARVRPDVPRGAARGGGGTAAGGRAVRPDGRQGGAGDAVRGLR